LTPAAFLKSEALNPGLQNSRRYFNEESRISRRQLIWWVPIQFLRTCGSHQIECRHFDSLVGMTGWRINYAPFIYIFLFTNFLKHSATCSSFVKEDVPLRSLCNSSIQECQCQHQNSAFLGVDQPKSNIESNEVSITDEFLSQPEPMVEGSKVSTMNEVPGSMKLRFFEPVENVFLDPKFGDVCLQLVLCDKRRILHIQAL
jgi:hypothetical protein